MVVGTFWNLRPSETGRQLMMFPFLGGFGASYNRLVSELEGDWDVWTANPPGHGPSPLEPLVDKDSLLEHYLEALRPVLKPGAVFFGHSMGGMVAYHLLAAMCGLPEFSYRMPPDVVLSGSCAPNQLPASTRAELPDLDLVDYLSSFGAIPLELANDRCLVDLFVPAFRADFRVLDEMRKVPLRGLKIKARLVLGECDSQTPVGTPAAWQEYFAVPITTHVLEREEHMFVLRATKALSGILNAL